MKTLLLVFGVFTCSTAVIFIKLCTEHPLLIASYRLLLAALCLTPFFLRDLKANRGSVSPGKFRVTILPGAVLALHFIFWIMGVPKTLAANASLIVNMTVIAVPFFLYFMVKEILTAKEIAGTVIALSGLLILGASDFRMDAETLKGDLFCFVSMVLLACYFVLAKKNTGVFETIYLYIVPLYYFGGLLCLAISLFFVNPVKHYTLHNIMMIAGLGLVPTVFGHSIINHCMQVMRGQIVSLINLAQFVFAGFLGYLVLKEVPGSAFYVASLFIVAGCLITILDTR